jgi:hypothetical protein
MQKKEPGPGDKGGGFKPAAPKPATPPSPKPPAAKTPTPPPPKPPVAKIPAPPPQKAPAAKPTTPPPPKPPVAKIPAPPPQKPGVRPGAPVGGYIAAAQRLEQRQLRREQRRSFLAPAGAAVAGAAVAGAAAAGVAAAGSATADLDALSSRLQAVQQAATLVDIQRDLEDVDSALAMLPAEIERVRARGYVFGSFLERKVEVLANQWAEMRARVVEEITRRSQGLQADVTQAQNALHQAYSGGAAQAASAQSSISLLESKVSAAQQALEAMFDTFDDNVTQTQKQIEEIHTALDHAEQASFGFHPDEAIVAATRAQYLQDGNEGPEGVLYLTDGRLIFERKEQVATKKVLFITTEKQTVQELLFEVPIGHVAEVTSSQTGFLGHREILEVKFTPEARLSQARLRLLKGDNETWAGLIGRVKSGEIERERVQATQEQAAGEAAQPAQAAPTKCPTCGALITTPIVKGMREITCEYCGAVIRL